MRVSAARACSASIGLLLAAAITAVTPAVADDPGPPEVTLHDGKTHQRGGIWSSEWTTFSGGGCATGIGDGFPKMGSAMHVGAGRGRLWFRFHTSQRPHKVAIVAWTAVDAEREPIGPWRALAHRVKKDLRQGRTSWVAVSRPSVSSDLYLNVRAYWKDRGPCGGLDNGAWTFHVAP